MPHRPIEVLVGITVRFFVFIMLEACYGVRGIADFDLNGLRGLILKSVPTLPHASNKRNFPLSCICSRARQGTTRYPLLGSSKT